MSYILNQEQEYFFKSRALLLHSLSQHIRNAMQQIDRIDRKQLQTSLVLDSEERTKLEQLRNEMRHQQVQLERLLTDLEQ